MNKALSIALLSVTAVLLAAGVGRPQQGRTYALDLTRCAGFTAEDAAGILGLPAASLKSKSEKQHESLWICSFAPPGGQGLSFSVEVAKSVEAAAADMTRLRENLEVAGGTAAFKDRLPNGAYSDIMGLGDDAVWTDVNGTLTARKGNITVQVLSPPVKMTQLKIVRAFFAKF